MKKVLSIILVLAAVMTVFCSCGKKESKPITSGDFTYVVLEDETAKIVGYGSVDEIITLKLPSALDEYTVTVIGSEAFTGNDKLNVVYLPETVKVVEENAFAGSSIRKLFAHQSVLEEIGESAFAECHNLIQVDLPRTLTAVEKNAFYYCETLKTVNFRGNTQNIDKFAFDACEKVAIRTDSENLHVINYANNYNIETKIIER